MSKDVNRDIATEAESEAQTEAQRIQAEQEARADRTEQLRMRLRNSPLFEEAWGEDPEEGARFAGHLIIGKDTAINSGISMGAAENGREAIVVDDSRDLVLGRTLDEFLKEAVDLPSMANNPRELMNFISDFVTRKLEYSNLQVKEITKNMMSDEMIQLGVFIDRGYGVCRHQGLLGAYLLEKLISEGLVEGKVSARRNGIPGVGAHAWTRYETVEGTPWIMDAAHNFVGTPRESPYWPYEDSPEGGRGSFVAKLEGEPQDVEVGSIERLDYHEFKNLRVGSSIVLSFGRGNDADVSFTKVSDHWLLVVSKDEEDKTSEMHNIEQAPSELDFKIGRRQDNDVQLLNSLVSRHHAVVKYVSQEEGDMLTVNNISNNNPIGFVSMTM